MASPLILPHERRELANAGASLRTGSYVLEPWLLTILSRDRSAPPPPVAYPVQLSLLANPN